MATKSYSKHKEFKEFSSSGNVPYTDEQFDMLKSELIPKGSKLESFGNGTGGAGAREYHYEYKEEKHPSGKYDRKDLHTVEQYTIPPKKVPKTSESNSYYYEREERELPAITSGTRTYNYETSSGTPGYTKVKSSKVTKDLSQNVEELDSLLDDLQKDQERQLYKSGYTSDTAESTSFDYKRGTPAKAPSSGYSTLKREERLESSSWGASPPPRTTELRQELYREETTGTRGRREERLDRVDNASWSSSPPPARRELRQELFREETTEARTVAVPPAPACIQCQHTNGGTLPRGTAPMNKVTTTVKTYTYEVPAGQDPTTVPLPAHCDHSTTHDNITQHTTSTLNRAASPGCQYCSHCNSHTREYRTTSEDERETRVVYPANRTQLLEPKQGPGTYKYSETSYSAHNTTQRYPSPSPVTGSHGPSPSPLPIRLEASPAPFPRPTTPSPGTQQPPKKLDDLLADFPEARFPTQPDSLYRRKVDVSHESYTSNHSAPGAPAAAPAAPAAPAKPSSRNVAGPAVYYPPGHTPFTKKPEAQVAGYQASSAAQGGGAYASGRGMYEYESGARSKEKHSERKTAVPICLPLCCAMPCVIM